MSCKPRHLVPNPPPHHHPWLGRPPLAPEAGLLLTVPLALDTARPRAWPPPAARTLAPPLRPSDPDSCLPPRPPEQAPSQPLPLLRRLAAGPAAAASDQPARLPAEPVPDAAACGSGGQGRLDSGAPPPPAGCPALDAAEGVGEGLGGTGAAGRCAASASAGAW
jgi:hypothetical protein